MDSTMIEESSFSTNFIEEVLFFDDEDQSLRQFFLNLSDGSNTSFTGFDSNCSNTQETSGPLTSTMNESAIRQLLCNSLADSSSTPMDVEGSTSMATEHPAPMDTSSTSLDVEGSTSVTTEAPAPIPFSNDVRVIEDPISNIFQIPQLLPTEEDEDEEDQEGYLLKEGLTQRESCVLFEVNTGYKYVLKNTATKDTPHGKTFRCPKYSVKNRCNATVRTNRMGPNGSRIDIRKNTHNHPPKYNPMKLRELSLYLRREGINRPNCTAGTIVTEGRTKLIPRDDQLLVSQVATDINLMAQVNYHRRKHAPPQIHDMFFDIDSQNIPARFLRADIRVGATRHLLFFTDAQMSYLIQQKVWYVDATFKCIKQPFMQLFSIHVIVNSPNDTTSSGVRVKADSKQIPVAYVIMGR